MNKHRKQDVGKPLYLLLYIRRYMIEILKGFCTSMQLPRFQDWTETWWELSQPVICNTSCLSLTPPKLLEQSIKSLKYTIAF